MVGRERGMNTLDEYFLIIFLATAFVVWLGLRAWRRMNGVAKDLLDAKRSRDESSDNE